MPQRAESIPRSDGAAARRFWSQRDPLTPLGRGGATSLDEAGSASDGRASMDPTLPLAVFLRLFVNPLDVFRKVRDQPGYGFPLLFAIGASTLAGVADVVVGGAHGLRISFGGGAVAAVLAMAIFGAVWAAVGAVIVHGLSRLAGGTGDFQASFMINALAMATLPLANLLGFAAFLAPLLGGAEVVKRVDRESDFDVIVVMPDGAARK